MNRIRVDASVKYDVITGSGILGNSGELIKEVISPCKACIITDDIVAKLYLDTVRDSLNDSGFSTVEFVFKNGEESKNAETLLQIVEFMASNHLTRTDIIVALGGGVVGDISGFAAATYLRGIKFIQIPTTFLADIDSSVGGKTAVNLKSGKNLWGAFHQPSLVICDTDCLKTLPDEVFADGVAEAVKYAILSDKSIIDLIKKDIDMAVKRCIEIKRDVVGCDEFEHGTRQLLNLGHTFGHSIEALSGYKITHGHAVAIGMVIASAGGERMGITKAGTTSEIISILESFNLPAKCDYSAEQLANCALGDKKRHGDTINLIIPEYIGKCRICPVSVEKLAEFAGV